MAKYYQKRYGYKKEPFLPLGWMNLIIFGIGLLVIAIGYFALGSKFVIVDKPFLFFKNSIGVEWKEWNDFVSLNIAPVLIVLGYVVIIPLAILYRKRDKSKSS